MAGFRKSMPRKSSDQVRHAARFEDQELSNACHKAASNIVHSAETPTHACSILAEWTRSNHVKGSEVNSKVIC
jgi:hypothetical protein